MYKAFVFLEVRVLLSAVPSVFIENFCENGNLVLQQGKQRQLERLQIQTAVLHKAASFVNAVGGKMLESTKVEKLTGSIQEPPDDKNFTGYSIKVSEGGHLNILFHQKAKQIKIEEIRIEEDCGHITRSGGKTHMDWTYAGCPVMRIKTENTIELGEEAELFLNELTTILSYLNLTVLSSSEACTRCNAYVSLAEIPEMPDYYVKLRNLNSFNFVRKAINSELSRQEEILSTGGEVANESRLWMEEQNSTQSFKERTGTPMRFENVEVKMPLEIAKYSGVLENEIELPEERRLRFQKKYGLTRLSAEFICSQKNYADYFEDCVKAGAKPSVASHWFEGEFLHLLENRKKSIANTNLTPEKFAEILVLLEDGKINSSIARYLMNEVFETGGNVGELVKNSGKILISSEKELMPYVKIVLAENEESVRLLNKGELSPLDYLTGCVMKLTNECAVPQKVKALIKKELKINIVYILTMGGAITARKLSDGTVCSGNALVIKKLLEKNGDEFPLQITPVKSMLSEETEPADWAALISEISARIESGTASGIVVTHGTDTLSYTAALLYWLFSASGVPVVLTASSTLPQDSSEAEKNLSMAVQVAREKKNGVYVVFGQKLYSPLNLKFTADTENGFENWNLSRPLYSSQQFISRQFLSVPQTDRNVMTALLNEASDHLFVLKLYPGQKINALTELLNAQHKINTMIIELYATGTGNMRNTDYSLKPLLLAGRKTNCRFYCTSQQKCTVDFSQYTTSARVWREGVAPMGNLTSESAVALYFAASLLADDEEELSMIIENSVSEMYFN